MRAGCLRPIFLVPALCGLCAAQGAVHITTTSLPPATVGVPYDQPLSAGGGQKPYTWSISSGALPPGLQLTGSQIGGAPTAAGAFSFTVQVADSKQGTDNQALKITVTVAPLKISTTSLPAAGLGSPYGQQLSATGGAPPYTWSISSGSLPGGVTLSSGGALSGTPAAPGAFPFTVQVADSGGTTATQALSITVNAPPLSIGTSSLPNGTVGIAYAQTLSASGGAGGFVWSVSAGSLPSGLALDPSGNITGTPGAAGTANFTVQVADSSGTKSTKALSLTVVPPVLSITAGSLPAATVGASYSQSLTATGGSGGYVWSVSSGGLPAGLSLSAGGAITGTPTAAGTASFTVQVADSSGAKTTQALTIVVNPPTLSITTTSLPNGTVGSGYSQTLAAIGGTGGYSWSVVAGGLPAGLNLSAGGAISGTPTAPGTANFTVQVADSSGAKATQALTIVVNPPTLSITTTSLPNGTVGSGYSQTLAATGGTGGYSWSVVAGNLPSGVSLSPAGVISGTAGTAGTSSFTVQVTDSSKAKATQALTLVIASHITITSGTLPPAVAGTPYAVSLSASGTSGAVTWAVAAGSLPGGLTLNPATGAISGTPNGTGTFGFAVQVTDSTSSSASAAFSITVQEALSITTPPALSSGSVGAPYSQKLSAAGGVPPYTWSVPGGGLPSGLSLSASSGTITGTPSQVGTFRFTVQVADASFAQARLDFTIVIAAGLTIANPPALPAATIGVPYSLILQTAGGSPPYVWSVTAGGLPGGLNFSSAGQITGTPTAAGSFTFTAQVTDASSNRASKDFTLVVAQALTIVTGPSLPAGTSGVSYSQQLAASGGSPPYTWSVSAGGLPPGISLDGASGALTGTPAATGTFTFTAIVTDTASVTAQKQFSIAVGAGISFTNPAALPGAAAGTAYSFTLGAAGGRPPYSWKLTSGSLPSGIALNSSSGVISGTPSSGGTFNFTLQVTDADGLTASRVHTLIVALPGLPAISINGPADQLGPMQQPVLDIVLANPYPVAITGQVSLDFSPAGANPVDDPAVQFSTGGRSAPFTIPANSTHASFASQFALQTGSVAGTITLQLQSLQAGGTNMAAQPGAARQIQIGPAAPGIQSLAVNRTSGGFNVLLTAISNTRELTQATIVFRPSAGSSLATSQLTLQLKDAAQSWFQGAQSAAYGGQFSLTLPFTIQGAGSALDSVSVVLSNSAGDSAPASTAY